VDRISKGDIPPRITDTYNGDFNEIKNNLNNCIDIMNNLLKEAGLVVTAAADGELDKRANAELFIGGWKKLVIGINEIVSNIVNPLMVTADYVDKVSKGVIPPQITDTYKGQYNIIKNNLNAVVKMMSELLAETDKIIKAAADGELDQRADATIFVGGWNKLVAGVNDTITNIVNPLMVTADYVDQISKGAIPKKITDNYKGQYNIIKNNLNQCIDAVNNLVAAQVAGRLKKELEKYHKPALLILDELGYLPIDKIGADMLFQIISRRYEQGSVIITCNRAFKDWAEIFNNDSTLTSALLDRVLHHTETIVVEGKSYRMKEVIEKK